MSEKPCAFHPDRLTLVSCSRCDRPICPDDMIPAPVGIQCPICAGRMREGALGQAGYRVRTQAERWPIVRLIQGKQLTQLIIAANVVVFVLMLATGSAQSTRTLIRFGALYTGPDGSLPASQWWRIFSSMFVHIGFLHIVFNMFALTIFGGAIESRHGKLRFLALYLGSGLLAGAASLAFNPGAGVRAGASGGVFGILGAWIAFFLRHRQLREAQAQLRSLFFLVGINLFLGVVVGHIDNFAHVGGLVGGVVIGTGLEIASKSRQAPRSLAGAGALLAVAGASAALIVPHLV